MLVMSLLSWWYGAGWRNQVQSVTERLANAIDRYSISLLLRSLFAPFRQISAGRVSGSIDAQVRAWADRLVSRCIGAVVRSMMIIVGSVVLVFEMLAGLLRLLFWPFVPVLPVIGFLLMIGGWMPWQR